MKHLAVAALAVTTTLFILVSILIRVNHPELTETQLLGRYWVLYLLNVVSMLFAIYEFRDDDR